MSDDHGQDTVDLQSIHCGKCRYVAYRFNQVPLTHCPKCNALLEDEWPEVIGE